MLACGNRFVQVMKAGRDARMTFIECLLDTSLDHEGISRSSIQGNLPVMHAEVEEGNVAQRMLQASPA